MKAPKCQLQCLQLGLQISRVKLHTHCAMVSVRTSYEIMNGESKWMRVPHTLLLEHDETLFLKLRPTAATIIALVQEQNAPKNASFTNSPKLQELLKLRNEKALEGGKAAQSNEEGQEGGLPALWDVGNERSPQKKRRRGEPFATQVVKINVDGQIIECLFGGSRPTKNDLAVKMDAAQLTTVFAYLKEDVDETLTSSKRKYKKNRRA